MARGLWVVCLFAVGCKGLEGGRTGEALPPTNGIVIDDRRPDWEKRPFTGPVTLYQLGKVSPNPWDQLAKETEAVVAAMANKPDRVSVTVTAFRLVKKDEAAPTAATTDPVQVRVGDRTNGQLNQADFANSMNYQTAVSAQRAGDQQTAQRALGAMAGQGASTAGQKGATPPLGLQVGSPGANVSDGEGDFFLQYPAGACCEIHAVIKLTFPGGQEQSLYVKGIGSSPNTSGTAYWGEALSASVRTAVQQYGRQFRQGVGVSAAG
jgi:hypothetical protein